jgi:glucosamine--fructose-6-phosphate aminotransferase (isomerizing)
MNMDAHHTYDEIKSQVPGWTQAIELASAAPLPDAGDFEQVIFTGCGSTYYLSLSAAALYQQLSGRPARAAPASELLLNPDVVLCDGVRHLLVAVSRSGLTTETIKAVEKFKHEGRGPVLVISTDGGALTGLADIALLIDQAREQSVAQTRSFAAMLVAATAVCARMAGRQDLLNAMGSLPETGARLISQYEPLARVLGGSIDLDRSYFLGSGLRYGLACEVSLKMKEMTLTHSEPFHFLEFRHGPMSMVGPTALVCGLLSDSNREHETRVLSEMQEMGARVMSLGESTADVEFRSGLPEPVRAVLYLPVLQLMALYRSLAKGLDPDRPHNLGAVVKLNM